MKKLIRNSSKDVFLFVIVDFLISLIPTFLPIQTLLILPFRALGAFPVFCIDTGIQSNDKVLLRAGFVFIFLKLIVAILLIKRIKKINVLVIVFSLVEIFSVLHFYLTSEIANIHNAINIFVGLLTVLFYVSLIVLSVINLRDPEYKEKKTEKHTKKEIWVAFCKSAVLCFVVEVGVSASLIFDKVFNSKVLEVFETHTFNPKVQFLFDKWVISENPIFIILVLLLLLIQIVLIVFFVKRIKVSSIILGLLYVIDFVLSIYQFNLLYGFVYAFFVIVCFSRYKQLCKNNQVTTVP